MATATISFRESFATAQLSFLTVRIAQVDPGPFPFAFTLGCLEIDLPRNPTSLKE